MNKCVHRLKVKRFVYMLCNSLYRPQIQITNFLEVEYDYPCLCINLSTQKTEEFLHKLTFPIVNPSFQLIKSYLLGLLVSHFGEMWSLFFNASSLWWDPRSHVPSCLGFGLSGLVSAFLPFPWSTSTCLPEPRVLQKALDVGSPFMTPGFSPPL